MSDLSIICFTDRGRKQAFYIKNAICKNVNKSDIVNRINIFSKSKYVEKTEEVFDVSGTLEDWTGEQFTKRNNIVFVGAVGIAVRAISKFLSDKSKDSAVIVVDEDGRFVIPILSGHIGGANELATLIANSIKATPVITTATDSRNEFAIDVWCKKNAFFIPHKNQIVNVSSKLLHNIKPKVVITNKHEVYYENSDENNEYYENANENNKYYENANKYSDISYDMLIKPKSVIIGIGCKKGKSYSEIKNAIDQVILEFGFSYDDIYGIASIDLKKDEEGIVEWANKHRIGFKTFSAEELNGLSGDFTASDFVKNTTGVDNVCERAAFFMREHMHKDLEMLYDKVDVILDVEEDNLDPIICRKRAIEGVTVALCRRKMIN